MGLWLFKGLMKLIWFLQPATPESSYNPPLLPMPNLVLGRAATLTSCLLVSLVATLGWPGQWSVILGQPRDALRQMVLETTLSQVLPMGCTQSPRRRLDTYSVRLARLRQLAMETSQVPTLQALQLGCTQPTVC